MTIGKPLPAVEEEKVVVVEERYPLGLLHVLPLELIELICVDFMAGPRTMHSVLLESAGVAVDGDVSDKSDILLPKSTLELLVQLFGEHYRYPSSIRFCENKDTEHTISFTRQQLQQLQCDVELLSIRRMVYTYNKRYTANLADQVYHAVQSLPNLRCVDYHQVTGTSSAVCMFLTGIRRAVRDRQQLQLSTLMKKRNALIVNIDIQNLSIIESIDHDQVFADLFEVDEDGKFVGGCVIESFSVKCPMTSFSGIPVLRGILHTVLSLQCGKRQQWAAAETTGTANQSVEPTSTAGQLAGVESFLSGQQIAKPASVPWSSLRKLHVLVPITSRCLALIPPFAHTIQSLRLSPADLKVCGVTATQHFAHLFERYSWPSLRSLWLLGDFFVRSAPLPKSTAEAIVKNCPVVEELHIHHSAFETAEVLAKLITELSVLKSFQVNSIVRQDNYSQHLELFVAISDNLKHGHSSNSVKKRDPCSLVSSVCTWSQVDNERSSVLEQLARQVFSNLKHYCNSGKCHFT